MIDCDAERRADLVLAGVEFADAAGVVVNRAHRGLEVVFELLCKRDDLVVVLCERQDGDLYRGQFGREL